jgi:hypothetical protein
MRECTERSLDLLGKSRSSANSWQRDELLTVARSTFTDTALDGIYFTDAEGFTEVILDNSTSIVRLVDYVVFPADLQDQYTADIARVLQM